MSNHLIIGLGGTGGKVLREFRKRVYEEFRSNDPDGDVFLDYLYVDSSPEDLNKRDGWKVVGKSVHLGEAQKVNINGISSSMIQNLGMYPGLQSFITEEDKQLIDQHMGPLITAGIGGQRRRLGRMLMANNLADRNNKYSFNNMLQAAVVRLQTASESNDVTFHICAGLAGGTGSGSIVDVISQIRKKYPYQQSTHAFKIRLFIYMPERNMVYADHDSGFYQANGYAALSELNAISTGHYTPLDITGEKDVFTQQVQRLMQGQETFEAAYIYSNVNENGKMLDLSQRLPASVADFMFQTIVVANTNGGKGKMARLLGAENDGAGPERDQNGDLTHSRKFMSFGITRVEYPETEIGEFATYNYAIQAARQLTFNKWVDGTGYSECSLDEVGMGFADEIKDIKKRGNLLLSNADLTLEKQIVDSPATANWKPFSTTWETRTQMDAGLVQGQYEKKQWLAEFTKLADNYFNDTFRKHGVKKFFDIQRQELKGYARHIRRHIEGLLFNEWASGTKDSKSILEIEKYAQLLRADCSDRITAFKQQISKLELQQEEYARAIKDAETEWNNIGWIRDAITNASEKAFAKYKSAKCNFYVVATKMESYQYAILLLQEIIVELGSMIEGVQAMKNELITILDQVTKMAASKCQEDAQSDDSIVKRYDPEKVHSLIKQYRCNFEYQNGNAAEIRARIVAGLGEEGERTFAHLYSTLDLDTASDIILDICTKNAIAAMENTAQNDPLMKMVGVNILDKLKVDLNTEDKIEKFVDQIIDYAKSYVQFNPAETSKVIEGNTGQMMTMLQVALPKAENDSAKAFTDKLIAAFRNKFPSFVPSFNDGDLSENFKPNQIVVVYANSAFPLRYLENMVTLKEKYDRLLAAPQKDLNRMVLHSESFKKPLPALFEIDAREKLEMMKPKLVLAFALKLIQQQQDPTTGAKFYAMNIPDEIFGDNWVQIGKDFASSLNVLVQDHRKSKILVEQVEKELAVKARSNDQKAELRKEVGAVVQQVILPTMCEGNQFSPIYVEYRQIAMGIINKELQDL